MISIIVWITVLLVDLILLIVFDYFTTAQNYKVIDTTSIKQFVDKNVSNHETTTEHE